MNLRETHQSRPAVIVVKKTSLHYLLSYVKSLVTLIWMKMVLQDQLPIVQRCIFQNIGV